MWIRMLGKKGDSLAVILPSAAREAMGWEQGDYLYLRMASRDELLVTRFNPANLTDALRKSIEAEPIIDYGN